METSVLNFLYLICIVLFIIGLKKLSHPDTAKNGNQIAALGMGIAILLTIFYPMENASNNYMWIVGGLLIGGVAGYIAAIRVKMTSMPEMVSLFNGLGGACSMLIASVEFYNLQAAGAPMMSVGVLTILFALFIGTVTFTGSIVAWGKLDGFFRDSIVLPKPQIINITLLIAIIALSGFIMAQPEMNYTLFMVLLVLSALYGIAFVMPIGGGDMPVVISLLNSFSGIAAAVAGLIYGNEVMIVGGIIVGASGTILSILMCNAMNRSLLNVIIGGFGGGGTSQGSGREAIAKEASHADTAIQLKYSNKVIIVPGYGLAVAQAQHACHDLEKSLEAEGVEVLYAIHPVAGRMPGHMNVLLAEADVPYPKLLELEDANEQFSSTDMVLVIGANDVVNPSAKEDPGSPIYGMPILEVEKAKTVIVLKRSMNPGYAGIENPLFYGEKTKMLFGDAKASLSKLKSEVANA
ncbi:MAG: NAD(P)(+) transhydrogenase (Re/Si-specific) subunit beta [Cyclobacteriaceae bacterium]|nr:NAD(P)(+) transhydrogenase (Re/Si-specific) subunit beta [Cyclobacteriaceae bacterium]